MALEEKKSRLKGPKQLGRTPVPKRELFAVCIQGTGFDLLANRVYKVLDDPKAKPYGSVRVIDESGEDYLYPASWFIPVKPEKGAEDRLAAVLASPPLPDREAVIIGPNVRFVKPGRCGEKSLRRSDLEQRAGPTKRQSHKR